MCMCQAGFQWAQSRPGAKLCSCKSSAAEMIICPLDQPQVKNDMFYDKTWERQTVLLISKHSLHCLIFNFKISIRTYEGFFKWLTPHRHYRSNLIFPGGEHFSCLTECPWVSQRGSGVLVVISWWAGVMWTKLLMELCQIGTELLLAS